MFLSKHNNAARSRQRTYVHTYTHSLARLATTFKLYIVWLHTIMPLIIPTEVEIKFISELTTIISNMGATKAHIVPSASDNQQLQRPSQHLIQLSYIVQSIWP